MNLKINLGNPKSAIETIRLIKENDYVPFDIRIFNTHITELNKVIKRTVFRKDTVYFNSKSLWELMQDEGGKGRHHYHGLQPKEIFEALLMLKKSKTVKCSYDNRYIVLTSAVTSQGIPLVVILKPNSVLSGKHNSNVVKIITIYPFSRKHSIK